MESPTCRKGLENAEKILTSAGFPVTIKDDSLSTFFAVEKSKMIFAYTAECIGDNAIQANAGMKGFEEELKDLSCDDKLKILIRLFRIPNEYNVTIGVEDDIILLYYPRIENSKAYTYIGTSFALSISIAGWLAQAIDATRNGEPIPEFKPEIGEEPSNGK